MLGSRRGRKKLPKGLDAWWDAAIGYAQATVPRRSLVMARARRVVAMEKQFDKLSDARLREEAEELHVVFRRGRDKRHHLDRAFAVIGEIIFRRLGFRLHKVQIAAAFAMEAGCIAELATGEGKTVSATLPATIAGWRGRGCHVMTVNDYLAARDAQNMSGVYKFAGLTCRAVTGEMQGMTRQHGYRADITYCTNKEVAADFLRDRLVLGRIRDLPSAILDKLEGIGGFRGLDRLMLRGLETAIVDEADSVLIDEAVTPLIISGDAPNEELIDSFVDAADLVQHMSPKRDYRMDERFHDVKLTTQGRLRLAELAEPRGGVWAGVRRREELIRQAITARDLYKAGKQYVVQEGKIVIVDEFTGRLMPDRTWRDGLHQAVEAKEGLEVQPMKGTLARISFQRFFRMYRKLAGMTGTAIENRQELWVMYHLPVVPIPTHKPVIRKQQKDRIYLHGQDRWEAIVRDIAHKHEQGRPVLIGTRSVGASEQLSAMLTERGLEHQVLNAVRHEEEADIVALAGKRGRITVATNMAGRGTDIKPDEDVKKIGGVHVIATERHEAGRIDRQLWGRTGRQGDPGTAATYLSLEDELFRKYAPGFVKAALNGRLRAGSAGDLVSRKLVDYVQKRAERRSFHQRKGVLKTDDWLEENLGFAGREF